MIAQAQAEIAATDRRESPARKYDVDRYRRLIAEAYASLQRSSRPTPTTRRRRPPSDKARAALEAARAPARRHRYAEAADSRRRSPGAIAERDTRPAQPRLHGDPRADRRRRRQPQRPAPAPTPRSARSSCRSCRRRASGSTPISRRASSPACGRACRRRSPPTCCPATSFHGHVASLAPATGAQFSVLPPENATGNFTKIVQRVPVRILLDGDAARLGRLRPGLSVTARR